MPAIQARSEAGKQQSLRAKLPEVSRWKAFLLSSRSNGMSSITVVQSWQACCKAQAIVSGVGYGLVRESSAAIVIVRSIVSRE